MQNYTNNANGDVPLIVESVWYFYFLCDQGVHMFFWIEKQNWSIVFFIKTFLLSFLF